MIFDRLPFHPDASAEEKLGLLMMGYRMTQLVYVAAELGIADQLSAGPKSAEELAGLVGANAEHLFRIMRALNTIGLFEQSDDGNFSLNPLSRLLCENVEGSVRSAAIRHGAEWSWLPWGSLLHSVRTGEPAFEHALGMSHWEYMSRHPRAQDGFGRSMAESSKWVSSAIINSFKFPENGTVVDVGGGHGELMADILDAYPSATGILLDRPEVIETARVNLRQRGLIDRCHLSAGDFFTDVPTGGDLYIVKRIIHDWNDDQAVQILQNCRQALPDKGRVLIVERIMPEETIPSPVKIVDITVMVLYQNARERTESEFRQLLQRAGLRLGKIQRLQIPAPFIETAGYALLEGVPL